jgi:hypothetical protein
MIPSLLRRKSGAGLMAMLAGAIVVLAACSNDPADPAGPRDVFKTGKALFAGVFGGGKGDGGDAPGVAQMPARIEAALATTPGPVMIAYIERAGLMTSLSPVQRNGAYETWHSPEGKALSLRGGVVVSSRGLADDLMASEADEIAALISIRGSGSAERVYYHLNGLGETQAFRMTCSVMPGDADRVTIGEVDAAATIMIESCQNPPFAKQNLYWVTSDGTVLKSHQWIGATLGHVTIVHVRQ